MSKTKKQKKLLCGGIAAIAAAAALLGGGFYMLFSEDEETITPDSFAAIGEENSAASCQKLMSDYYTAIMGEDAETLYKLMAPPEYWEYYMETYGKTEEEIIDTYADAINNTKSSWQAECGSDAQISFKIDSSGEQSEEFLTEWSDTMNEAIGSEVLTAQEAMTLSVTQTISGSKGTDETINTPTCIKVNDSWYILDEGTGSVASAD